MKKSTGGSNFVLNGQTHYQRHRQYYIDKRNEHKLVITEYILSIKQASSCKDCGNKDWRVFEFDHLSNKVRDIAKAPAYGWSKKKVDQEIAKCDIVCANCHRIRTWQRRENFKK